MLLGLVCLAACAPVGQAPAPARNASEPGEIRIFPGYRAESPKAVAPIPSLAEVRALLEPADWTLVAAAEKSAQGASAADVKAAPSVEKKPRAATRSRSKYKSRAKSETGAKSETRPKKTYSIPAVSTPFPGLEDGPKSVLVVGDSFAQGIGWGVKALLTANNITVFEQGKISSGLMNPKFYDWEANLKSFLDTLKPDAVVVMLGGNDSKAGAVTSEWMQLYTEKVKSFIKIATSRRTPVYWIGLPPMAEKGFCDRAFAADQAIKNACDASAGCHFVDAWKVLSDGKGAFCTEITLAGRPISVRSGDGVHLTMNGYRTLSQKALESLAKTYKRTSRAESPKP